ncbi:MAG TPA: DHA2 family efflux MFS transporter permease subunit [Virgibacillus sp.]|nr:DHA2 family efflux MFS transporter permease subunit [Virgibacillus sp.]HLR66969.1 DHA2 family efflux MFS transporter permease subunit [Virgibacillus sp.]
MNHSISASRQKTVIAILMLGAFIAILNQTLLTTVLPEIMESFHLTSNTAQWLTTIFMLVNGIMIPITAFLIGRFTTRGLFSTAVGLFLVGSLICLAAPNFSLLLIGRAIQAAGAGILMPLVQTVLFVIFPPNKRGMAMGMFGLVIGFAPAIGPTAAGWIVNIYPWRILFLIIFTISLIDILLGYFFIHDITERENITLDKWSIVLSTLGFGGLLYGFSMAGQIGWENVQVYGTIVFSIIILYFFIRRQLKLKEPMLEFRVFKAFDFTISMTLIVFMFMIFLGTMTVLPIYMQTMRDFTSLESGLILLPGGLFMGLLSPVAGKIFDKLGGRILAIGGMLFIAVGSFLISLFSSQTSVIYIIIAFSILMIGNAGIMTSMTTAAINALPQHLISHGTAMNNTIRQIAAAIGTGILVTMMTNFALNTEVYGGTGIIHGLQVTYRTVTGVAIISFILAFFVRNQQTATDGE